MPQLILIHGGDPAMDGVDFLEQLRRSEASLYKFLPKHDWKTDLDKRLGAEFQVLAPRMPNKDSAHYEAWVIWFEKIFPFLDEEVILVGHSLGALFLVKYLATHNLPCRVRALVLTGTPSSQTPGLGDFALGEDIGSIVDKVAEIHLFHSQDDPVVPYSALQDYASAWPRAHIHSFKDRGHFNQDEFPELLNLIKSF